MSDLITDIIRQIQIFGRPSHDDMRKLFRGIEQLQQRNAELEAHVERLSNTISSSSLVDDPHIMSMLNATPQQSLNALKREVLLTLARRIENDYPMPITVGYDDIIDYANTRFKD